MTVADNAHLQHIKLAFENARSYHFAHNDLLLGRDASAFSSSFLLGGRAASPDQHPPGRRKQQPAPQFAGDAGEK
ncbi:hypothetical protein KPZU09_06290 [Klebsiella pneumoniae]|uniref:Iron-sulfur cluster assembly protein SufD n=1 Tax=Klebsiella pneumoniae TaxID=573 RepID=A0A919LPT7_KLEPN|nr:hypothetical protein KPZU09_06290 [Klebsiella pneumoniae]